MQPMVWLRTCGLRSSIQTETAAFHIEYSHAKGQYCEASMVLVVDGINRNPMLTFEALSCQSIRMWQ